MRPCEIFILVFAIDSMSSFGSLSLFFPSPYPLSFRPFSISLIYFPFPLLFLSSLHLSDEIPIHLNQIRQRKEELPYHILLVGNKNDLEEQRQVNLNINVNLIDKLIKKCIGI